MVVELDSLGEIGVRGEIGREDSGEARESEKVLFRVEPDAFKLIIVEKEVEALAFRVTDGVEGIEGNPL